MKKFYHILAVAALFIVGCSEKNMDVLPSSDTIMFGLGNDVVTRAAVSTDSDNENAGLQIYSVPMQSEGDTDSSYYLITTIEDNTQNPADAVTRGTMITITSFDSFGWFAADTDNTTSTLVFDNQETTGKTENVYSTGQYWPVDVLSGGKTYSFFAYYPYLSTTANGLTLDTSNKTITYDVTSPSIANQQDLMVAYASTGYNGGAAVPLTFKHACTAIKFKTSSDFDTENRKITKVELLDVYTNGTCTMGGVAPLFIWNLNSKSDYTVYDDATGIDGNDAWIISESNPLMMIPQNLTAPSQKVRVTFVDKTTSAETKLTANLQGSIWEAGKIVTYAISPTAITGLKTLTVDYPLWKNSSEENVYGPVFRYENEDFFGLFAVNTSNNKVAMSNVRVGVSFGSTTATCNLSGIETLPETGYDYYIMYPYRESVTGAPAVDDNVTGATADLFFANVITNWTVSDTQNTFATHKEQDLQIAKATIAGTSASAKMVHKMGLAKVALGTTPVTTTSVRTYSSQTAHVDYTETSTDVDITATSHLDAASELRLLDASSITGEGGLWTIVKPGSNVTLNSVSSSEDAWSSSITASVTKAGHYEGYTALSGRSSEIALVANFEYNDQKTYYQITLGPGTYKLEVWGAQGGDGRVWNDYTRVVGAGGKGGYTNGTLSLSETTTLYVCVGGQGEWAAPEETSPENHPKGYNPLGGYNGGGNGGTETNESTRPENAAGGGGATHIATSLQGTGVLSEYRNHKNDVLIVAGGGGGAAGDFPSNYDKINYDDVPAGNMDDYGLEDNLRASLQAYYGGDGGSVGAGTTYHFGNSSKSTSICGVRPCSCPGVADGGNDTYFGQGQDGCTHQTNNIGGTGGGGGGWYGGTYGGNHRNAVSAGGAGGSGHVHASLTNPGGIVGARSGNGYARITKL